jgi:hypothetical protein
VQPLNAPLLKFVTEFGIETNFNVVSLNAPLAMPVTAYSTPLYFTDAGMVTESLLPLYFLTMAVESSNW